MWCIGYQALAFAIDVSVADQPRLLDPNHEAINTIVQFVQLRRGKINSLRSQPCR